MKKRKPLPGTLGRYMRNSLLKISRQVNMKVWFIAHEAGWGGLEIKLKNIKKLLNG